MTRLNLPADVAKARMIEVQQQNQIYSMAFQIYMTRINCEDLNKFNEVEAASIAWNCIRAAKVFNKTVQEDAKHGKSN